MNRAESTNFTAEDIHQNGGEYLENDIAISDIMVGTRFGEICRQTQAKHVSNRPKTKDQSLRTHNEVTVGDFCFSQ